jgi:uncharacterized membrane protein
MVVFKKIKHSSLIKDDKIEKLFMCIEKEADKIIFIPILIYTIFFSIYTINMHHTFRTYAWDLGIIAQSLWSTLNAGKMLYSTLEINYGNPTGNFLGVHFSPILLLILPIYAIYQSPETLLVLQSFILAITALPIYWIARDKLENKLFALVFATMYLINPALHGVNTFDFHLEIFTPIFIAFSFYYIEKEKWIKASPFIILELMTLEFAPIIVFSLGLYFFIKRLKNLALNRDVESKNPKKLAPSIILMILSTFCFYLSMYVIETINPLKVGAPPGVWRYWGSNTYEALKNILYNPGEAIITITTPLEKPYFMIFLFSSTFFLPIFAPFEIIIVIPWLIFASLTDYPPYYQPYFQYSAFILSQLYIASIYGFHNIFILKNHENNSLIKKRFMYALIIINLFLSISISPVGIPQFTERTVRPYAITSTYDRNHIENLHKALDLLPNNASVATIWDIFPHVSQRLDAYFLDVYFLEQHGNYPAEYILVDMKSPCLKMKIHGPTPAQVLVKLMKDEEYGLIASLDGVLLLKRGYRGVLQHYQPQRDVFNYKNLIPSIGKITWDYTSLNKKVISSDSPGMAWFGPYKYFAPGTYEVTFRIKTSNETCIMLLDIVSDQGTKLVALRNIYGSDFKLKESWQDFKLRFKIDEPMELEFRGMLLTSNTKITLDYIMVEQISP